MSTQFISARTKFRCDRCGDTDTIFADAGFDLPSAWIQVSVLSRGSADGKLRYHFCKSCSMKVVDLLGQEEEAGL